MDLIVEGLNSAFVIDEDNYYADQDQDNSSDEAKDDANSRITRRRRACGANATVFANIVGRAISAAVAGLIFKSIVGVARSASVPATE